MTTNSTVAIVEAGEILQLQGADQVNA